MCSLPGSVTEFLCNLRKARELEYSRHRGYNVLPVLHFPPMYKMGNMQDDLS